MTRAGYDARDVATGSGRSCRAGPVADAVDRGDPRAERAACEIVDRGAYLRVLVLGALPA